MAVDDARAASQLLPKQGYHSVHLTPDPARSVVWTVIARHLSPWISSDADVLELGAGYCDWINAVRARRRVAIDLWAELPRHAAEGVEPLVMDLAAGLESLDGGTFDVVLASNLLEHFEMDASSRLVAQVVQVLRPGGRFILIQPNFRYAYRRYFDDYTHRTVFTDTSLATLLRAHGLHLELVEPRFLPYSMKGARVPIAAWMVRAYLRSPFKPRAGQMLIVARRP